MPTSIFNGKHKTSTIYKDNGKQGRNISKYTVCSSAQIRAHRNNFQMNQPDFDKFVTAPFHLCSHILLGGGVNVRTKQRREKKNQKHTVCTEYIHCTHART